MAAVYHGGGVVLQQQQQAAVSPMAVTYHQGNVAVADQGLGAKFNPTAGRATGWIQLMCAIGCIILGIVELILGSRVAVVGYGIWGGLLFFLPAGILGIVSVNKNACVIVAYMVMSILSALTAVVVIIMGGVAADYSWYSCSWYFSGCDEDARNARIAVDSLVSIMGFVEFITAIVAAAYCCAGVCCGRSHPPTATVMHHYTNTGNPMVVSTTVPYGHQQVVPNYGGQPAMPITYPVTVAPPAANYPYPTQNNYPQQAPYGHAPPTAGQQQHPQGQQGAKGNSPPPEYELVSGGYPHDTSQKS